MNPERWQKVKGLFDAAVELAPAKRGKFLKKACGTDAELRREIENLLASFDKAESFMDTPAAAEVASLIVEKNQKLKSGQNIAHYETLRQIGEGGMGEVYLAKDTRLNRKVALKVLPAHLTTDKSRLRRFKQEAQAASALNHPNIITIYEIREFGDTHLIATEFVEGVTIRQKMAGVNLKTSEILDIAAQVASALSVAHNAGVIHRDIKPENIMIRPDGIVKLLDFGLAKLAETSAAKSPDVSTRKLTNPGMVMGTVNYMSPEQAQGKPVDRRTDLWSLGICLYEMLAGKTPFMGKTINHTLVAIMENQPPPLVQIVKSVPAQLGQITAKLLEKKPEDRYLTANDLLFDLRRLQRRLESELSQEEEKGRKGDRETLDETAIFSSSTLTPNNLSGQLLPLIGREPEIAEIKNLLKRDSIRLLTLTGIGGTGKTRLAFEIAAEMLSEFADGVFFIALAAVRNAEFVTSEIAQPLGVKDAGGKSLLETLKDFLKEKQILLVVDNFEQVLSAAPVLNELLTAAPRLKILVTSRALLHLRIEREFIVPPLNVPSDIAELSSDDLLQYESVKLFTERAQAVKSNLAGTKENLQIIAEICSRLDGLPLAIELAAARVKILSPPAILSRLESSLNLLTGGAQDLPAHQKTMRGAIEWSFDLLDEQEKILFRRLAVFAGGFTVESAEAVCANYELQITNYELSEDRGPKTEDQINVLDLIASLVDKSLLVQKEQADGDSRFRLLEVVREYASEVLQASGESEMIRKNHAAFFLALAKEAEPELFGKQGTKWLNRLEEEHDNLRAALSWSTVSDVETAINLTSAMRRFWILHNHLTEGRKWLESALERSSDTPPDIYFKLLNALGFTAGYQGDYETARKAHEKGLATALAANDLRQIALSNRGLGAIAKKKGDIATARKFIGEALKINRDLDDTFGIAVSLNNLGDLARMEGNFKTARPLLEESLAISRQIGNKEGVCGSLNNLAATAYGEGDFAAARSYYSEALAMAQELGDKITVSYSLDGFAALAVKGGDVECAARLAGAAEHLRKSLGFDTEPAEQRFRDAYLVELQTVLDEKKFAVLCEQGRALPLKKAVALALQKSNTENDAVTAPFQTPSDKLNAAKSIAVLPFLTIGLKEDEEYLGLGLADALITQLSQARRLTVRPTNAVRAFTDARRDAAEIGKKLNVGTILEGNLQKSGERLRVTVQLTNIETGATLWADKFSVDMTDFFEVQDQIAAQVSKALLLKLNTSEQTQINKRFTENNAAYLEYLKGRHHWEKRDIEGFHKAVEHFKQAIDFDPTFALAFVGLSDVYCMFGIWAEYPQDEIFPRAKAAALRALEIDENLAEAHASLGRVYTVYDWDWTNSEKSYQRAIELNPSCLNAHSWLAKLHVLRHRYDEAIGESKIAQKLDPLSPQPEVSLGAAHFYARRYPEAIERYRKAVRIHTDFVPAIFGLGMCLAEKGEFDEAIALQKKAVELSKNHPLIEGFLAATYAYAGNRQNAFEFIEKFKAMQDKPLYYTIAAIYSRLNEKEEAFSYLEKSFAIHDHSLSGISIEPEFDNLRDEPRFREMLRRVGLENQLPDEKIKIVSTQNSLPTEKETLTIHPVTDHTEIAHPTSSAEYLVTEIKRHKRGTLIFLAVLALILTGAAGFYFYNASGQPKFSSIAVLPLNNASGDVGLEYLSDGLSENLINKLSQIGQLKVIAQSSAFRFKGKEFDPKAAGQALGVEALLTGRITKFGDGLSISIELISARDGSIIWNEKYNLISFDAAFDTQLVQGKIALQIAEKLNLDLTGTQNEQLKKRSTQNLQAYQLFLNASLIKRKFNSVEANRKAVDYYNQAIALDPNFALAYVSLANSYRFLQLSSNVGNKNEIEEKMRQAIAKAQELDDALPEVYTSLGGIKLNEFDWTGSEKAYKRAIELDPNSSGAHSGYAGYLTVVGKFDEALTHIRLAEQLDPLSINLKIAEGRTLFAARRYDEAIRFLQTLAKTAPDNPALHYYLAISYTFKGMYAEALAAHEKATEISGGEAGEFYIYTLAKAGKIEQARQYLEKAKKRENYSPAEFAVAYIALGDKEQAFALLEKAYQERDPQLQYLKIDPHYDEIRSDPRFQELLRKLGF